VEIVLLSGAALTDHEVALDPLVVENELSVETSQTGEQLVAAAANTTPDHVDGPHRPPHPTTWTDLTDRHTRPRGRTSHPTTTPDHVEKRLGAPVSLRARHERPLRVGRAALVDGASEQLATVGRHLVQPGTRRARTLAEERDAVAVAAERRDVVAYPAQRHHLVLHAEVA